jgi:hypothetical protein
MILPTMHLPSSLSLSVIPMGSSVFRWNWTSRTRVIFSISVGEKRALISDAVISLCCGNLNQF